LVVDPPRLHGGSPSPIGQHLTLPSTVGDDLGKCRVAQR
jgi:hypothetical protein